MKNEIILITIAVSVVVSVISNKLLAVHTLNAIDGYVKEMIEVAKASIRDAHSGK